MSEDLSKWYAITKKLLSNATKDSNEKKEMIEVIEEIEIAYPDLKIKYEQTTVMQKSFTQEQKDFICYQIGDWYLEWKNNLIVNAERNVHRLGFAKETLKTMICGD